MRRRSLIIRNKWIDIVCNWSVHNTIFHNDFSRLSSLVGITERETGVGILGLHGNSSGFDRKNIIIFFFLILLNEREKKRLVN